MDPRGNLRSTFIIPQKKGKTSSSIKYAKIDSISRKEKVARRPSVRLVRLFKIGKACCVVACGRSDSKILFAFETSGALDAAEKSVTLVVFILLMHLTI